MRTTVRTATVAAAAVVAALAAPLSPAQAVTPPFGPVISALPAIVSNGGAGNDALTTAVSTTCASGAPLAGAEWFSLSQAAWGPVLVDAEREILTTAHRDDIYSVTHVAVVNLSNSSVLQCGGAPLTVTGSQSLAFVAWVDQAEWQTAQTNCGPPGCDERTWLYVDRSAPVPDNDTPSHARPITALPFSDTGNSVRATTDHPDAWGSCSTFTYIDPTNYGDVWWRWTAPADGVIDAVPGTTDGDGPNECTGLYDVTSGSAVPVDHVRDSDTNPTTQAPVIAGHSYLIGLFTTVDGYYQNDPLQHGGPYSLDVSWVTRGPGPVSALTTESSGTDGIAVSWQAPAATPHAAAVTGYHVSVVRHGSGDTPLTVTVGAATLAHTFTGLVAGASYDIAVHALSDSGDGELRTRLFSLADAGTYGAVPGPPASVVVRRATSAVNVVWTVPSYTGTTDITGYRVRVYAGLTSTLVTTVNVGDVRTARVGGLRNGVAYTVDVAAVNSGGTGTASRRSNLVVPASRPGAPVIGRAWSGVPGGATSAVVSWTAPRATGGAPIRGYAVTIWRVSSTGSTLWTRVSTQPATARLAILRLPAGLYRFSVRAVNVMGVGPTSGRSNLVVSR